MLPDSATLQSTLLKLLADPNTDKRLGRGVHYLAEALRAKFPGTQRPMPSKMMEAVWSLIAQGLAYIDYSQPAPEKVILSNSTLVRQFRLTLLGAI